MPRTCSTADCKRTSCALCHCCEEDLCLSHLKEHQDALNSQLNPLVDQINQLETRLQSFQVDSMMTYAHDKLEQWRLDCYKKIDQYFEHKCQELLQYANEKLQQHNKRIEELRKNFDALIAEEDVRREDIEQLKGRIHQFEQDFHRMQRTTFKVDIQTYRINDNLIRIEEFPSSDLDLVFLPSVSRTIDSVKKNSAALATNDHVLLMYQPANLCLYNGNFQLIRTIPWNFGEISDMFWSSVLKRFLILHERQVFLVDDEQMTIENLQMVAKQNWCCGTCSEKSLFLATYQRASSIMEFNLLPSIEFVKQWRSNELCSKDEGIHDINYFNEKLIFIVENCSQRKIRVDLRSSFTFDRFWTLLLESVPNQNVQIRCCSLNNDQWMIAHHDRGCLLHITKDGHLKEVSVYQPAPHFVCTFSTNGLVVVSSHRVNLHKLALPQFTE